MIKNLTTSKVIAEENLICKTLHSKARGLMFRKPQSLVMIFDKPQKVSLHMMFVKFTIDVFYLDENKKAIEIVRNFKPWTGYTPKSKANYVIEVPSEIEAEASIGDVFEF